MKYTTVSFDVGGTLMRMDRECVAHEYVALADAHGAKIDLATTRAMFAELDDEIPKRARRSAPLSLDDHAGEIFWRTLFNDGWLRLGLGRDEIAVDKLYRHFRLGSFNRVFDDVSPTLQALQARGVAVGVLTNFTANCETVLRGLGIANYFSFFAVSAIVRAEKPERAIFDYAVRAVDRPAGEILHVGDSPDQDVEGARAAGLGAILLDRDNWHPDYSAAPRVRRLTELVDLF